MQGHMRPRECIQEWNTLSQVGESAKDWTQWLPNAFAFLGSVALMQESRMFKALIERANKHQIGPIGYHWKFLQVKIPKVPLYCSFRLEMHELWSKEKLKILSTTNPFIARSNHLWLGHIIHCWKYLFQVYKILPSHVPHMFGLKKIWTSKVLKQFPGFGTPIWESWEKMSFECSHHGES